MTNPLLRLEKQVLNLAMFKKRREPDPVVSNVGFVPKHSNIVLSCLGIILDEFLTAQRRQSEMSFLMHIIVLTLQFSFFGAAPT